MLCRGTSEQPPTSRLGAALLVVDAGSYLSPHHRMRSHQEIRWHRQANLFCGLRLITSSNFFGCSTGSRLGERPCLFCQHTLPPDKKTRAYSPLGLSGRQLRYTRFADKLPGADSVWRRFLMLINFANCVLQLKLSTKRDGSPQQSKPQARTVIALLKASTLFVSFAAMSS
jgi:hypothetical protein